MVAMHFDLKIKSLQCGFQNLLNIAFFYKIGKVAGGSFVYIFKKYDQIHQKNSDIKKQPFPEQMPEEQ